MKVIKPEEFNTDYDGEFYRDGVAHYVNNFGIFSQAAHSQPRINYKLAASRTNYIRQSENFTRVDWGGVGLIFDTQEYYNGVRFKELIANTTIANWTINQTIARVFPKFDERLTCSFVVKAGTTDRIRFGMYTSGAGFLANENLRIEGPGALISFDSNGMLLGGLSQEEPTVITFTYNFTNAQNGDGFHGFYLSAGDAYALVPGESVKVAYVQVEDGLVATDYIKTEATISTVRTYSLKGLLVEKSSENFVRASQTLNNGSYWYGTCTCEDAADVLYSTIPFYRLIKSDTASWEWTTDAVVSFQADEVLSLSLYLMANTSNVCTVALLDAFLGVGPQWRIKAFIEEGPGEIVRQPDGRFKVINLNNLTPTRVVIRRLMDAAGTNVNIRIYPSSSDNVEPVGASIKCTAVQLEKGEVSSYIPTNTTTVVRPVETFYTPYENLLSDSEIAVVNTTVPEGVKGWGTFGAGIQRNDADGFFVANTYNFKPVRLVSEQVVPGSSAATMHQAIWTFRRVTIPFDGGFLPNGLGLTGNPELTFSFYARANTLRYISFSLQQTPGSGSPYVEFDLQTGTSTNLGGTALVHSMRREAGDYWKCSVTTVSSLSGSMYLNVTNTSGVYSYGLASNLGLFMNIGAVQISRKPSTYIPVYGVQALPKNSNLALIYSNPPLGVTELIANQKIEGEVVQYHPTMAGLYNLGRVVSYRNKEYEVIGAFTYAPGFDTGWLELGSDNRHKMLDISNSNSTVGVAYRAANKVSFIVNMPAVDSVSLFNLVGQQVSIGVTDSVSGKILYSNTLNIDSEFTQVTVQGLPRDYNAPLLAVEIVPNSAGVASLGSLVIGNTEELGITSYGASSGIIDYSRKEVNEFGESTFVQRTYSKKVSASVYVDTEDINRVQNLLYSLRATPCVWISTPDSNYSEPLTVFGFYRDFNNVINYPTYSMLQIEIEGLT